MTRFEWIQRHIFHRTPFGIHVDGQYEEGVDIRISTSRLIHPDDLSVTLLVEQVGKDQYEIRVVAQYAPSNDGLSPAQYQYRREQTVRLPNSGQPLLTNELSYFSRADPLPPQLLPVGRPIDVSDRITTHNSALYFELSTKPERPEMRQ